MVLLMIIAGTFIITLCVWVVVIFIFLKKEHLSSSGDFFLQDGMVSSPNCDEPAGEEIMPSGNSSRHSRPISMVQTAERRFCGRISELEVKVVIYQHWSYAGAKTCK